MCPEHDYILINKLQDKDHNMFPVLDVKLIKLTPGINEHIPNLNVEPTAITDLQSHI